MRQVAQEIAVRTPGPGLTEFTSEVADWLASSGARDGLLTLFIRHTSASLTIQENADPSVCRDLQRFFAHLVPESFPFEHDAEGPDDMPAHIKSALTQVHLSVPVSGGRMLLGSWQGLYVFEHRARPHERRVVLQFQGELDS